MQILLGNGQIALGRTLKQGYEKVSCNNVQDLFPVPVRCVSPNLTSTVMSFEVEDGERNLS